MPSFLALTCTVDILHFDDKVNYLPLQIHIFNCCTNFLILRKNINVEVNWSVRAIREKVY